MDFQPHSIIVEGRLIFTRYFTWMKLKKLKLGRTQDRNQLQVSHNFELIFFASDRKQNWYILFPKI